MDLAIFRGWCTVVSNPKFYTHYLGLCTKHAGVNKNFKIALRVNKRTVFHEIGVFFELTIAQILFEFTRRTIFAAKFADIFDALSLFG